MTLHRALVLSVFLLTAPAWAQTCGGPGEAPCAPVTPTVMLSFLGDPSAPPYAMEASVSPPGAWLVTFLIDGNVTYQETTPPYCLFGHDGGCLKNAIGSGSHNILVRVSPKNSAAVVASAETSVQEGPVVVLPPPIPGAGTPLIISIGVPVCALAVPPCFTVDVKLVPVTP